MAGFESGVIIWAFGSLGSNALFILFDIEMMFTPSGSAFLDPQANVNAGGRPPAVHLDHC